MGTIITDCSHFTVSSRSFSLRQATVIVAGFLPRCSDLRLLIGKVDPVPSCPACYGRAFRMSVRYFPENCFSENNLRGRSALQTFVRVALLLLFECKSFPACTILCSGKLLKAEAP